MARVVSDVSGSIPPLRMQVVCMYVQAHWDQWASLGSNGV